MSIKQHNPHPHTRLKSCKVFVTLADEAYKSLRFKTITCNSALKQPKRVLGNLLSSYHILSTTLLSRVALPSATSTTLLDHHVNVTSIFEITPVTPVDCVPIPTACLQAETSTTRKFACSLRLHIAHRVDLGPSPLNLIAQLQNVV